MKKNSKIVKLRYNTWSRYDELRSSIYQILPTWIYQKEQGQRKENIKYRIKTKSCPVCEMKLDFNDVSGSLDHNGEGIEYYLCPDCGFWRCEYPSPFKSTYYEIPSIRRFDYESETPSLAHLSHEVYKDRSIIYNMSPKKFEIYVGSILSDYLDCEVHHVGQTGDDGTDLIALIGEQSLLIQVKRRGNFNTTEGIDVVKLLFASAFARGSNSGMVVTSAKKFSQQAQKWVESDRIKDVGFKLDLVDFHSLLSMTDAVLKKNDLQPWEVHHNQERKMFFDMAESKDAKIWSMISLLDGDILCKSNNTYLSIIAFQHADLSKCYTMKISAKFIKLINKQKRFSDLLNIFENNSEINVLHDDLALELVNTIPYQIVDKLNKRWLKLFPKKLENFNF